MVIEEITSSNTSLVEQLAHNMNMVNNLEYFSTGLFVIFLCYVLTKNIKSKTNRIGVGIVVVSTIASIIYQLYFSLLRILFVNNSLLIFLYQYHTYITLLLNISKTIGLLILFVGLIKSKTINSKLIVIPIVCCILLFVGQFFAGHSEIDNRFIIYTIVEIANIVVAILYVILFSLKKINKESLTQIS